MSREFTQTAADGASRSFYFFRPSDGNPWMTIKSRDRDGKTVETIDIKFTDSELKIFIEKAGEIL